MKTSLELLALVDALEKQAGWWDTIKETVGDYWNGMIGNKTKGIAGTIGNIAGYITPGLNIYRIGKGITDRAGDLYNKITNKQQQPQQPQQGGMMPGFGMGGPQAALAMQAPQAAVPPQQYSTAKGVAAGVQRGQPQQGGQQQYGFGGYQRNDRSSANPGAITQASMAG